MNSKISPTAMKILRDAKDWQAIEASSGRALDQDTAVQRAAGLMLTASTEGETRDEIESALMEIAAMESVQR